MQEDSDDDDAVQLLLTILPPSPATKRRTDDTTIPKNSNPPNPPSSARANASPSASTVPTLDAENYSSDPLNVSVEGSSSPEIAGIHAIGGVGFSQQPQFSHRTSAYLQSLAEICHGILWDVRWRVGGSRLERLLQWERGEDLSAVVALARRYLPPTRSRSFGSRNQQPCSCIVCENGAGKRDILENHSGDVGCCEEYPVSPVSDDGMPTNDDDDDVEHDDDDDEYDRALNLYARLYSRKGPWFRIDDLFKYYTPKHSREFLQSAPTDTHDPASTPKVASPSKFFLPKTATKRSTPASLSPPTDNRYIDQEFVKKELHCVSTLLQDLKQLYGMGLVRSFKSEEECGQTIGEIQSYGLLKQEEQRIILAKLGGSNKAQDRRDSLGDNKIWKQMCQQQSIKVSRQSSGSNETVLLPVSKHVDQALIASWASALLLRARRLDYIPQGVLKKAVVPIQRQLQHLVKEYLGVNNPSGLSLTCLRLREAPLLSLQRCCRLYLCATLGPGEMRGDTGTNGWKALPGEVETPLDGSATKVFPTQVVSPPCAPNWHRTMYPGRDFRFKLISCAFQKASIPMPVQNDAVQSLSEEELRLVQVFSCVDSFHLWEQSVIIRSTVDYLMEANDLILYNERKLAREQEGAGDDDCISREATTMKCHHHDDSQVDFLKVLPLTGRRNILHKFTSFISPDREDVVLRIEEHIEADLQALLSGDCTLKTECERVLCVIGIIATHLLQLRNETASRKVGRVPERPWLRHLWWEGCLVYLLWDIIPILEQRGYYHLATTALEILLFGKVLPRSTLCPTIPKTLVADEGTFLAQAYLSRRARGKAFDRLVIDYLHILRYQQKETDGHDGAGKKRKRKGERESSAKAPTPNDLIAHLCGELLKATACNGQISFCSARTLARRLKQPLSTTLAGLDLYEVVELGHRYSNQSLPICPGRTFRVSDDVKDTKKYSDWGPVTDNAVANAMLTDGKNAVGGRCSYVGFEDQDDSPALNFRSLNVEELAMEYYHSGRLPENQDANAVRGGWVGWHDEGGKLRTLFRILASCVVLGSDWGCSALGLDSLENATIHLTPYQGAPFDLHVGAELGGTQDQSRRGFYQRRRNVIDAFLNRLHAMSQTQVSELVYRSIHRRWQFSKETHQADPTLAQDVQQTHTLCATAAGFGGKMLAALCRCLFFDYRHYSGGLPDLTLCRAIYERDDCCPEESLVDLGTWIGEGFSPDQQAERDGKSAARMLEDQDDEFLGCSKNGDSGRRNPRGSRSGVTRTIDGKSVDTTTHERVQMPEPLLFQHAGRRIRVECMLVEVKSQNDRLDARQEDWLNILDIHGNVRVCKFGAKIKGAEKTPKPSSREQPIVDELK